MWRALVGALVALAVACSSDAAVEPEPKVETPGAFVAFEEAPGQIRVVRVLGGLALDNGTTILFVTSYQPLLPSFEAAEDLARSASPPIALLSTSIAKSEILSHPYQVVWFRTLTDAEKDLAA